MHLLTSVKKNCPVISGLVASVCITLYCQAVYADTNHYNNLLIGDRAAGLGGAYTAIADDPSGLYYNPAGIVYSAGANISGSMNALHTTSSTYKNALGGNTDWKRESSALLPSFFGVVQPFGDKKIGFSYAVVDSIQEDQDQTFTNITQTAQLIDSYTINFNNQVSAYNIGPSFGYKHSESLSFGITLYGHISSQERIIHQLAAFNVVDGGDYFQSTQYLALDETGFRPIFGVMWSPMEKLSVGFSLSQTFITSSEVEIQSTSKAQNDSVVQVTTTNSKEKRDYPLQLGIGAAYFYDQRILYTGEINYFSDTDDNIFGKRESIVNFALGMEYYLDPELVLRGGFFSNFSNSPDLKTENVTSTQPEHIDLLGVSFSISRFTRSTQLSFGIVHSQGSGEAQLFPPQPDNTTSLQDVDADTLTLFLAASYSY